MGPYVESCVHNEVEIMEPRNEAMQRAVQQMRGHGIRVSNHNDGAPSFDVMPWCVSSLYSYFHIVMILSRWQEAL